LLEVLEHSEDLLDAMSDPRPKGFGREDVQGGPIKLPPKRYNCRAEVLDTLIERFVKIVHLDEVLAIEVAIGLPAIDVLLLLLDFLYLIQQVLLND
jgi:hypothetical protein